MKERKESELCHKRTEGVSQFVVRTLDGIHVIQDVADLNNSPLKREGFDLAEAFLLGGSPRFAVTSTTKSFLTQSLYGEGRNPPPSEPPELALSDPFSGLNDYDTGVKPGCYSG